MQNINLQETLLGMLAVFVCSFGFFGLLAVLL